MSMPAPSHALPEIQYLIDLAREASTSDQEEGASVLSELIDQIQHCWRGDAADRVEAAMQKTRPLPDLYRMMYLTANHAADTLQHVRPNQEARLFSVPVILDAAPDAALYLDTDTIATFVGSLVRYGLIEQGMNVVVQSRLLTQQEALAPRSEIFKLHETLARAERIPLNVMPDPQTTPQRALFFIVGTIIGTAVDVPSEIAVEEELDHLDLMDWFDEGSFILAQCLDHPELDLPTLPCPFHAGVVEGTAYYNRVAATRSFQRALAAHRVAPENAYVELMSTASLSTFMVALQSGDRTLDVVQWDVADEPAEFRDQRIEHALCEVTEALGLGDACAGGDHPGTRAGH
jgi:hypothetical protein